jgi:Chaperone of endosialidase
MKPNLLIFNFLFLLYISANFNLYAQQKTAKTEKLKLTPQSSKSRIDVSVKNSLNQIYEQKSVMDQVIPDDLIVQSSFCVGLDCVNGEIFNSDIIRLKANNNRIGFDDTSTTVGFPANDWQITANENAINGLNKFSIEDITGAKVPFTVVAGAKTNSLYIGSTGKIGIGTASPALATHILASDTPAIRLDQDNSGGFTPQVWDIAGNEANFFIRDVTAGSTLPFRIKPGAPTSSIEIQADGTIKIKNAIVPLSDFRLKKNLEKINNATSLIKQMNPMKYDFRYEELKEMGLPKERQFGLIAQELEKVVPELVFQHSEGKNQEHYKGINYTGLIPILIQGMKDQQAEIEALKQKLANYESIDSRLTQIEALLSNQTKNIKSEK